MIDVFEVIFVKFLRAFHNVSAKAGEEYQLRGTDSRRPAPTSVMV